MVHEFVFILRGSLSPELRPQAVRMAERLPELLSRKKCPGLYRLADRINARPKADPETIRRRRKIRPILGLCNLLLSLFALGPALLAPEELLSVLIAGLVCLISGIACLWSRHRRLLAAVLVPGGLFYGISGLGGAEEFRPLLILGLSLVLIAAAALLPRGRGRKRRAAQEGNRLFDARGSIGEDVSLQVRFTEEGMWLGTPEAPGVLTPFADFLGMIEAEDLLLIGVQNQGFLLNKSELTAGAFSRFREELAARVVWISAVQRM